MHNDRQNTTSDFGKFHSMRPPHRMERVEVHENLVSEATPQNYNSQGPSNSSLECAIQIMHADLPKQHSILVGFMPVAIPARALSHRV